MKRKTSWRRTVGMLNRGFVWSSLFVLMLAITGVIYQTAASEADQRKFPPPGNLIDVGGFKMHIYCEGEGSPTVILDAMSGGTVANWGWIQPEVAKKTRVCAYDRAGFGWSEPDPQPLSLGRTVRNLHVLLANANIEGPIILVGHSIGGTYARGFTADYPDEVQGVVLVDTAHPQQFLQYPEMFEEGEDYLRTSAGFPLLARLGVLRLYFDLGGEMDFAELPERQKSEIKAFWSSPEYFESQRAEIMAARSIWAEALKLGELGELPLMVVSRGQNSSYGWSEMQSKLAALSTESQHITVKGATHASLAFNPSHAAAVSNAILQLVDAVRQQANH